MKKTPFLLFLLLPFLWQSCQTADTPPIDKLAEKHAPYEELFLQRSYPDDFFDIKVLTNAVKAARQQDLEKEDIPGFDADWVVRGPGNIGARVNTVAVHPTNSDIMYAGFSQGGVFKTTDGGATWTPIFDDQAFLSIGDIEIDPTNPETVYVGTGDPNISGYPFIGDGLYRTTDGGQTWTNLGLSDQRIISKIILHPTNSNIIYAGCMGLPFERNEDRGLYRSIDGGQAWEQVLFLADEAGIIDMVMHPSNPDVIYAAGWDRIRNNRESYIRGFNGGVFKTEDGGDNWTKLANGLPEQDVCRIGLTISATDPNKVWAMYIDSSYQLEQIYRTDNGGQNWTPIIDDIPTSGLSENALGGFGWYFCKIRVNPFNNNDLFLLGVDLWRSLDGGQNWFLASPEWWQYDVHADKHDLQFVLSDNNMVLATDGGLYRADINTMVWEDIENIPTTQFYRVAYNPHLPDWYYGGAQDNGTSGGIDVVGDWFRLYGGDGFQPAFHPTIDTMMYAETQNGNIVRVYESGFVESATLGIDFSEGTNWDMQYILSPHNPDIMYTGTIRAYKSLDGGLFWFPISDDLTDGPDSEYRRPSITTLSESPITPGILYYGTVDANVWRSTDDGASWTNITGSLPDRYVTDIKASPTNEDWVYVTHSGYKDNDFTPRVHRSTNRGDSWEAIDSDLPDLAINDIYILPDHQDSILFVATDGGVYGSVDYGENWDRLGENMPFIPVYDLEWNVERNELIAGTHARSIMTYPIDSILEANPISSVSEQPDFVQIFKLWPVPTADQLQVQLEVDATIPAIQMNIMSLSGQIIQPLGTFDQQISNRQYDFDVSDLPAGSYLLQLVTTRGVTAKPFLKQ